MCLFVTNVVHKKLINHNSNNRKQRRMITKDIIKEKILMYPIVTNVVLININVS